MFSHEFLCLFRFSNVVPESTGGWRGQENYIYYYKNEINLTDVINLFALFERC